MPQQYTILKNNVKPDSQNYEKLRTLGLKYIEQFSKDVWTDYNVHDPGITTLEVLSYAITDIAYRTSLPLEDILARETGDTIKDFFTAREILPCNPVTFDDLRKKIIDVEGVENAWVFSYNDDDCAATALPSASQLTHPAYFIKCNSSPKSIDINGDITIAKPAGFEAKNINGLYTFNLLLEEDAVLGDLNILSVDWEMRDAGGVRKALIRFMFPLKMQKTYPVAKNVNTDIDNITAITISDFAVSNIDKAKNTFDLLINPGTLNEVNIAKVAFHIQPVHTADQIADLKNQMWTYISNPANKADVLAKIFSVFVTKVKKISSIIDDVYCMYQHVRNLCEDVIKIGLVPSQEIAVCADVETENAIDLENVLGQIYFAIDTFFSPVVKFYLLKELIDKKISSEIIFEGPLLKHGFILDEDLQQTSLFSEIHVSDLYNLIMSIAGVKTVKYLQVTNYYNGQPLTEGEFWKLILNQDNILKATLPFDIFHLNLDRLRSKITFYKGDMPIIADKVVANRIFNDMKATISKPRINPSIKVLNNILPPVGQNYKLDDYYSIQNDFPYVYGVNKDGVPAEADINHKTKIKQLKGYLLFFDQLLANYLSQLLQIKNLFAVGNNNNETYFFQPVYDLPTPDATANDNVYSTGTPVMPDTETLNFYSSQALLKDFATPALLSAKDIDDESTYITEWTNFINNKKNAYLLNLTQLVQTNDDKLDRRNRFLDHLLARFAENFSDYAAMMYKFTGNVLESMNKKTAQEIADDKFHFLEDYDVLSYNRGKGQFYKCCAEGECDAPPVKPDLLSIDETLEYDSYSIPKPSNATGLHKRAALLLGMNIADNSNLALNKFIVQPFGLQFQFVVQYDALHQVTSVNFYATEAEAFTAIEKIIQLIIDENNKDNDNIYFEAKAFGGGFRIEIKETTSALTPFAVSSPLYTTIAEAEDAIPLFKNIFFDEGMHVIEHVLLRPLPVAQNISAADLEKGYFPLCPALDPDCDCPVRDYYSFRISVVLPYWTERFRNIDFRNFAEDTIHRETPAHILPKFCWVNMSDMNRLEKAYIEWFEENRKYKPDMKSLPRNLNDKLKDLIKVMNTLTNIYPEGHLHDCDNPSTDNPVILNQTILGTF